MNFFKNKILSILFFLISVICFSSLAFHGASGGKYSNNKIIRFAVFLSQLPIHSIKFTMCYLGHEDNCIIYVNGEKTYLKNIDLVNKSNNFDSNDLNIKIFNPKYNSFILLPYFSKLTGNFKIILLDINKKKKIQTWIINQEAVFFDKNKVSKNSEDEFLKEKRIIPTHPLLASNGDLIVQVKDGPVIRLDRCSYPIWINNDGVYHHSMEFDDDKNVWTSSKKVTKKFEDQHRELLDYFLIKIDSKNGKVLYKKSLIEIFLENNKSQFINSLIYSSDGNAKKIFKINDVQPVKKNGTIWKKGDVFISMHVASTIILYRPETNKIVWMKQGPWRKQHDVDIITDNIIGIYDNNLKMDNRADFLNRILYYDFKSNKVSEEFDQLIKKNNVSSGSQSLFSIINEKNENNIYIEEQNNNKIIFGNSSGAKHWEIESGGYISWSRYINNHEKTLKIFEDQVKCN